ncbi:MAG: hypothetical protein DMF56_22470 [Acidobacteria bacterium]|nr:MAG: hypothetical protein DMF56_22470 [Acidobacteriota bacterium]
MNRTKVGWLVMISLLASMAASVKAQGVTPFVRVEIDGTPRGPVYLVAKGDEHDYLIPLTQEGKTPIWTGKLNDTTNVPLLNSEKTMGSLRLGDSRTGCLESHPGDKGEATYNFTHFQRTAKVYDIEVRIDADAADGLRNPIYLSYVRTMAHESNKDRDCRETRWFDLKGTDFEILDLRFPNASLGLTKRPDSGIAYEKLRLQPGRKYPRPDGCGLLVNDPAVIAVRDRFKRTQLIYFLGSQRNDSKVLCELPSLSPVAIELDEKTTPQFKTMSLKITPAIK